MNRDRRILAIASSGGHWVQLRRLLPAFEGLNVSFASVYADSAQDVPGRSFYSFCDFSRFKKWNFVPLVFQLFGILMRVRPDVVITTGAAPGLIMLIMAKYILRSKTIWIDSVANCVKMSTSGIAARHVVDVWLTQWPHLAKPEGPECWGAVL